MDRNIKYKHFTHDEAKNGNQLLQILFTDNAGHEYCWTPKWKDLSSILEESIQVERMNGGKHWMDIAKSSMWVLSYLINLLHLQNKSKLPSDVILPNEEPVDMLEVTIRKMVI